MKTPNGYVFFTGNGSHMNCSCDLACAGFYLVQLTDTYIGFRFKKCHFFTSLVIWLMESWIFQCTHEINHSYVNFVRHIRQLVYFVWNIYENVKFQWNPKTKLKLWIKQSLHLLRQFELISLFIECLELVPYMKWDWQVDFRTRITLKWHVTLNHLFDLRWIFCDKIERIRKWWRRREWRLGSSKTQSLLNLRSQLSQLQFVSRISVFTGVCSLRGWI